MQDLASLEKNSEVYRRTYARNMMEQAEALLQYSELDEAERLANVAATQQVSYNLIEMKPQDLLSRIAVMRSGQTPPVRSAAGGDAIRGAQPSPDYSSVKTHPWNWSANRAKPWRPASWIGRKNLPAKRNRRGGATRRLRPAKTGRNWCSRTSARCASVHHRRWFPPLIMKSYKPWA